MRTRDDRSENNHVQALCQAYSAAVFAVTAYSIVTLIMNLFPFPDPLTFLRHFGIVIATANAVALATASVCLVCGVIIIVILYCCGALVPARLVHSVICASLVTAAMLILPPAIVVP